MLEMKTSATFLRNISSYKYDFFSIAQQSLVALGLLSIHTSRWRSDAPQSVGLLRTSDQSDAGTSTWQHTTFPRGRYPCFRQDSNPQS